MGDALLLGSCMCCVAFLCCLLLTVGRSRGPKQSLVLKKLVGESSSRSLISDGKMGSQLNQAKIESVWEVFVCLATSTSINVVEREPNQKIASALK